VYRTETVLSAQCVIWYATG